MTDRLTPEQLEQVRKADITNLLKRVKAGKVLTDAQLTRLREPGKTGTERYASSATALAKELDISTQALYKHWTCKPDFPTKTGKGWPVIACLEYVRDYKMTKASAMTDTSELAAAKLRKIEAEVEKIEAQVAIIKRESIPIAEHNAEIEEVARIFLAGCTQFVQEVAANTKDADLLQIAEKVGDRMKEQLEARL